MEKNNWEMHSFCFYLYGKMVIAKMIHLRILLIFGIIVLTDIYSIRAQSPEPAVIPTPVQKAQTGDQVAPALISTPSLAIQPSLIVQPSPEALLGDYPDINEKELNHISKLIENFNISDLGDEGWVYENRTPIDTRRILFGERSKPGKRPYMVYLQLTAESAKVAKYKGWLCGGVVVHKNYVLTSAACVEDADKFYIVSGTSKYIDAAHYKNDECVCKHRRKVVWKCIPKNYKFDFQDSQKWSQNDIAVVKVNKPFCFDETEKGCEFAVKKVCYNNVSRDLEKPGTKGWIMGWGSQGGFREGVYRREGEGEKIPQNAKCLQEAKVCIMDNDRCAKKWSKKFKDIIKEYMICTKDIVKQLSEVCDKKYANCTYVESNKRRQEMSAAMEPPPKNGISIDVGRHHRDPEDYSARRFNSGGFCENDHGGPLVVKYANKDRVIGVISACKIDPKSHSCHGPFLYTSVFANRQFISCAINKDIEGCKRVFRAGVTHDEWPVNWEGVDEESADDAVDTTDKTDKIEKPEKEEEDRDDTKELEDNRDIEDKKEPETKKEDDRDDQDDNDAADSEEQMLRTVPDPAKALRMGPEPKVATKEVVNSSSPSVPSPQPVIAAVVSNTSVVRTDVPSQPPPTVSVHQDAPTTLAST